MPPKSPAYLEFLLNNDGKYYLSEKERYFILYRPKISIVFFPHIFHRSKQINFFTVKCAEVNSSLFIATTDCKIWGVFLCWYFTENNRKIKAELGIDYLGKSD